MFATERLSKCLALGLVVSLSGSAVASGKERCGESKPCRVPPTVTEAEASEVGEEVATLGVTINPGNASTRYEIAATFDPCDKSGHECVERVTRVVHKGHVRPSGKVRESITIAGLVPGCTYSLQVTARNARGTAEGQPVEIATSNERGEPEGPKFACDVHRER